MPLSHLNISENIALTKSPDSGRCNFFVEHKKRYCRFQTAPGQNFCGNHLHLMTQTGEKHVPCPIDPSHTVPESKLKGHLKKCSKFVAQQQAKAQPFFIEDVNAGSEEDPDLYCNLVTTAEGDAVNAATDTSGVQGSNNKHYVLSPFAKGRAAARSSYVASKLGNDALLSLIARVEDAFQQECQGHLPPLHDRIPDICKASMRRNDHTPYSEKHGLQQASIIGNMLRVGILPPPAATALIELGAGKGYLSLMLSHSYASHHGGTSEAVLVDYSKGATVCTETTYGAAKRTETESHASVVGGAVDSASRKGQDSLSTEGQDSSFGAVVLVDYRNFKNKADRQLRDRNLHRLKIDLKDLNMDSCPGLRASHVDDGSNQKDTLTQSKSHHTDADGKGDIARVNVPAWVCVGKHLCGAATDYALRACFKGRPYGLKGVGNKGNETETELHHCEGVAANKMHGLAVAPCCHHRCGWRAYTGKALFRDLGFSPEEFEVLSWMTGWALCGHGKGAGSSAEGGGEVDSDVEEEEGASEGPREVGGQSEWVGRVDAERDAENGGKERESKRYKQLPCEHNECPSLIEQPHIGEAAIERKPLTDVLDSVELLRERKMAVGLMCKMLIDHGRLLWLQDRQNCKNAELVCYCSPDVSGENRLLLAKMI
ncbi:hypothetical protein CEUSTIGMA_g3990.t1 [Chlamydomonas eustigma]|uniref:tRNA:m(4)X modification enzyme TRM13 n=1 Tax=Chlamydomonas eustigma TaxID=1157962 RepID=A0A250X0C5_9CHLO|nr:hypothetical protein CEUSTIGMA_g3990.t1 [Chlamydomonas eustigma]|eukprot:GAX76544.1 hypothetical protein CEUSTIGMA_g3990.t1 [Chlamydomonas eustigma]